MFEQDWAGYVQGYFHEKSIAARVLTLITKTRDS